jgi:hypothetical protein
MRFNKAVFKIMICAVTTLLCPMWALATDLPIPVQRVEINAQLNQPSGGLMGGPRPSSQAAPVDMTKLTGAEPGPNFQTTVYMQEK